MSEKKKEREWEKNKNNYKITTEMTNDYYGLLSVKHRFSVLSMYAWCDNWHIIETQL